MASIGKFEHKYYFFKVLRIILGLFFIYVAVRKIFALDAFAEEMGRYDLFPVAWEEWIAYLGLACELTVGFCLVFKKGYVAAVILASGMCLVFIGLFTQAWIRGLSLSCHCLGVERKVTSYPFEIAWRIGLLLLVLSLLWEIWRTTRVLFTANKLGISKHI